MRVLERYDILCPFGVRFYDPVTHGSIGEGLRVTARLPGRHAPKKNAHLTRSDVFAFRNLPGLHDIEIGRADGPFGDSFDQGLSRRRHFVIEVEDIWRRFLPFSFTPELPHRGLFKLACLGSPPWPIDLPEAGVPLFSSPARSVPGGMAVVRAQIEEFGTSKPAAGALLEIEASSAGMPATRARGLADSEGRAVVMFPYPELAPPPSQRLSPPAEGQSLSSREWSVRVRIFWGPVWAGNEVPDICMLLRGQPEREPLSAKSPLGPLPVQTLRFGQELVLRSEESLSVLFINPAARRHKQNQEAS
jgi:hypothetical protein